MCVTRVLSVCLHPDVTCGDPITPANGDSTLSNRKQTASFACKLGYRMLGPAEYSCDTRTARWMADGQEVVTNTTMCVGRSVCSVMINLQFIFKDWRRGNNDLNNAIKIINCAVMSPPPHPPTHTHTRTHTHAHTHTHKRMQPSTHARTYTHT